MIVFNSSYTFDAVINDGAVPVEHNTVSFHNKGEVDATIDVNYPLNVGQKLTLGGRENANVKQNFALAFTGAGNKLVTVVYEVITPIT